MHGNAIFHHAISSFLDWKAVIGGKHQLALYYSEKVIKIAIYLCMHIDTQ